MKKLQALLFAAGAEAVLLVGGRALAFPRYLTSLHGTLMATPSFAALTNNRTRATRAVVNLRKMMTLLSK
jgi:hypothetical protein